MQELSGLVDKVFDSADNKEKYAQTTKKPLLLAGVYYIIPTLRILRMRISQVVAFKEATMREVAGLKTLSG